MRNLIVYYDPHLTTSLEDVPIPTFDEKEILIKVVAVGSNPKDWKHPLPEYFDIKLNQGDDVGGIVEAVGSDVRNFRKGDRVAGFHEMDTPRGAYAEYTVCPESTVFHIPKTMSFEEAATIPLAAYTAAVGLYRNLGLPYPFDRSDTDVLRDQVPLVVNAASSAVGAFAVKLAKLNPLIYPIVGVAGASVAYATEAGCDFVVDYRDSNVVEQLQKALGNRKVQHVFDASNSLTSVKYLVPIMADQGCRYTMTARGSDMEAQLKALAQTNAWQERIWVGSVHEDKVPGAQMFGAITAKVFEWATAEGNLKGHPYNIVPGGLHGVKDALTDLRDRKSGNHKYVTRIADTK